MPRLLLPLLLLACTCVRAQKTRGVVQEVENADRYFFHVELEEGKAQQLMQCTNKLTVGNVSLKKRGRLLPYGIDEHTELAVNIRRRLLTIKHSGSDLKERRRVKEKVVKAKECLSLPATNVTTGT